MKILIFSTLIIALPPASAEPTAAAPAKAATRFLATLNGAQKARAALPLASDEHERFHYTPQAAPKERGGLPLKAMTAAQRTAALELLSATLSEKGNLKATQIMSLETMLAKAENDPVKRDPEKYFVTIFGTPGDPQGWAWRFEGHHLAIHMTTVGGKGTTVTPTFFGTNPAEVKDGPKKGLRVLAVEEDLGRDLATSLVASGKTSVIFSEKAPKEILTGERRKITVLAPVGVLASEMDPSQQATLYKLISEYTGRYRPEIAVTDRGKIEKAGPGNIRFGWAGDLNRGGAHYYRVQGPTFLMELANTQNDANHVHTTWRDLASDFGRDLLGEHLENDQ